MSRSSYGLIPACCVFLALVPAARAEPPERPRTDLYGDPLPDGALMRLGTVRWRHDDTVCALRFSDDGKTLLSCAGGALYCWDRGTGRQRWRLGGAKDRARSAALSADGKTFAALWDDGIRAWDVAGRKERGRAAGKQAWSSVLALSPEGSLVAAAYEADGPSSETFLGVWEVGSGKPLHAFTTGRQWIYGVAFSPDGRSVAFGGSGGVVRVRDVRSGEERCRFEIEDPVKAVAFSPDGKTLAVCGFRNVLQLRDADTGELRRECAADDNSPVTAVLAFSPDGKTLAQPSFEAIRLWDTATGKERRTLPGRQGYVHALAFSPDGKTLASGGDGQTVALWDVATGEPAVPFEGHQNSVTAAAFAPDSRTLASASDDGTVRLWDMATGKELRRIEAHDGWVKQVFFTPDGKALISAGHDHTVRWWDAATGRELRRRSVENLYYQLALSPDGKLLACDATATRIQLWDAATGDSLRGLGQDKETFGGLYFAAGGRVLASTRVHESAVRLWDVGAGVAWRVLEAPAEERLDSSGPPLVAVSADGRMLAAEGRRGTIHLWETLSGKRRGSLRLPCKDVRELALSPDGRLLAAADAEGTVHLWGLCEGKTLGRITAGRLSVYSRASLVFSSDGRTLGTLLNDTTILLWPVNVPATTEAKGRRTDDELWADLGAADAERAWRAAVELSARPRQAVSLLKSRLQLVAPPDAAVVARLLTELGDDEFEVREKATRELAKFGELADPSLRRELTTSDSPEVRRRVKELLEKVVSERLALSAEALREERALEVLEVIGTPEARAVLERLAQGAPGARLTQDAEAGLTRLAARAERGR